MRRFDETGDITHRLLASIDVVSRCGGGQVLGREYGCSAIWVIGLLGGESVWPRADVGSISNDGCPAQFGAST